MGKKLSHIFKFLHSENSKMSLLNENVNQLFLNKTLHLYRFDSLGKSKGAIDPKINEFFPFLQDAIVVEMDLLDLVLVKQVQIAQQLHPHL